MKKSYSLCAQLHNLSLEFDSVGFQQALSSAGQGPACSRRWLLLPNKLGSQDKTKSRVLKMHYKSTSRGIQLQHKSISSGFPKWQGDGYVLNTAMNNSVFMYLPDFTRTHPDFSLKAAFFSNHCCFKKKSHGPGDNPCSRARPKMSVPSAVQQVALVGAALWISGLETQGQMDTGTRRPLLQRAGLVPFYHFTSSPRTALSLAPELAYVRAV